MLSLLLPLPLLTLITATSIPRNEPQHVFSNPVDDTNFHFPTVHEETVKARRIMHLSTIGNLVTSFPLDSTSNEDVGILENRPQEVEGAPIGLMEYYADCEPDTGNPTVLAINIATPYKNYDAGSNISLAIRWWPKTVNHYLASQDPDIPTPHTPAALPRFSLHGRLEPISTEDLAKHLIPACFLKAHPDSVLWQPGNDIHTSQYMRLVVEHVYWFGGFGDRARIGWLPIEEWKNVTVEEISACRLPGEAKKSSGRWRDWL
jgi:hypothetical protein